MVGPSGCDGQPRLNVGQVAARGGEKMVGLSGREGQKRSTSLMEGQVAPLGLQVFPQ